MTYQCLTLYHHNVYLLPLPASARSVVARPFPVAVVGLQTALQHHLHFSPSQMKGDMLNSRRNGRLQEATAWRFSSAAYWLGNAGKSDVGLTAVNW